MDCSTNKLRRCEATRQKLEKGILEAGRVPVRAVSTSDPGGKIQLADAQLCVLCLILWGSYLPKLKLFRQTHAGKSLWLQYHLVDRLLAWVPKVGFQTVSKRGAKADLGTGMWTKTGTFADINKSLPCTFHSWRMVV